MALKRREPEVTKTEIGKLMMDKLRESDIDAADAKMLGYKPLSRAEVSKLLGYDKPGRYGFQLPYHDVNGKTTDYARVRYLEDPRGEFGAKKKRPKYTQREGQPPKFYLPPIGCKWTDVASDNEIPVLITEGEIKAACACKHGYPTIGLGGVWSWRSRRESKAAIDDFGLFKWSGRDVYLVFDSDLRNNPKVKQALSALAQELSSRGAVVYIGYLPDVYPEPEDGGERAKTGLDDFIVSKGADALEDEVLCSVEPYSLSKELWDMNEDVAVITDPGMVVNVRTGQLITAADFKGLVFAHRRYKTYDADGGLQEKSTASEWLKWPHRLELSRLTFKPGDPRMTNGEYNTWRGWAYEPKKGSVKPWKDLMDVLFAGEGAAEARRWFEKWCASLFQNPGVKPFTSVLLWGVREGTGKSITGQTIGRIMGEHFSEIGNVELHSPYNDWAAAKQLVLIDEIASADRRERTGDSEILKKLVTQRELWVNPKYGKKYKLPDCVAYIMTSNNPDALRLSGAGGDRRFFIWEVRERAEQAFYDAYWEWLEGKGPSHLFHYLLELDISDFNPAADAPLTSAKTEMGEASRSHVHQWLYELLDDPDSKIGLGEGDSSDLYTLQQVLAMYETSGGGTMLTGPGLAREMKRLGFERYDIKSRQSGSRTTLRLYAVRNRDAWARKKPAEMAEHYERFCPQQAEKKSRKNKF